MKKVVYDGACRRCQQTMDRLKQSPEGGEFQFIDFVHDPLPSGVDLAGVKKEIHVMDDRGAVHRNADGMMEILATSKRWKRLASIGRLPILRVFLRWGYRFIARYRHGHRG